MFVTRISLVILGALVLSACVPKNGSVQPGTAFKPVKLKVQGSPPELVVDEPPTPGCMGVSENRQRGCVVAQLNEVVFVSFKLLQSAQWHLATFEICPGEDKRSDLMEPCTMDSDQRAEFVVTTGVDVVTPDANGIVDLTAFSADLSEFELIDLNTVPGEFFYRIQACPDDTDSQGCIWTDPAVRNKGRGRL